MSYIKIKEILFVLRNKNISTFSICVFLYNKHTFFNELVRKDINVNEHTIPSTSHKLDTWTQIKGAATLLSFYTLHLDKCDDPNSYR
jgi:hypothetical protein